MQESRSAAIKAGEARYYTGRPCKHGHLSVRDTVTGACIECRNERSRLDQQRAKKAIASAGLPG